MDFNNRKPIIATCLACTIWGLSGVFYDLLSNINPIEVLAHRSFWAMIFLTSTLCFKGQFVKLIRNLLIRHVNSENPVLDYFLKNVLTPTSRPKYSPFIMCALWNLN